MIQYRLYDELDDTIEIAEGFFDGWPSPPSKEIHRRIMANSYRTIVAVDEEKRLLVGFITIISDGVLSAYIPLLEVVKEYRSKGIGKKLVERAIEETKDLYMIDLSCDDNVVSFYDQFNMFKSNAMFLRNFENQSGKRKGDS